MTSSSGRVSIRRRSHIHRAAAPAVEVLEERTLLSGIPAVPGPNGPIGVTSDTTPTLTWNAVDGAASYDLLVYEVASGQLVVAQTGIVANEFSVPTALKQSTHQAFVRAVNGSGASGYSAAFNFDVVLNAPTFSSAFASTIDDTPTIPWNAVDGAASYEVLVYNIALGAQIIHQTNVGTTNFTPASPFASTHHQVFVRAFDTFGEPGEYSGPQTIAVGSATPAFTIVDTVTSDATPTFTWTPVLGAASYELLLYNIAAGQIVIHQAGIAGTEFTPAGGLAPTGHQAFVRAVFGSGDTGAYSAPHNISIVLSAPNLTGPGTNSLDVTPTITWTPVADAATYDLLVYHTPTSRLVVNQTGINPAEFTTPVLAQGTHQAFVRSVDVNGNAGIYSTPLYFHVVLGTPTLTAPVQSSNDTTPTFAWTGVSGAAVYEIIVYNVASGQVAGTLTNIGGTQVTQPTPVAPGQYQVFVRAVDAFGAPGAFSPGRNFEILAIVDEELHTPVLPDAGPPQRNAAPIARHIFRVDQPEDAILEYTERAPLAPEGIVQALPREVACVGVTDRDADAIDAVLAAWPETDLHPTELRQSVLESTRATPALVILGIAAASGASRRRVSTATCTGDTGVVDRGRRALLR